MVTKSDLADWVVAALVAHGGTASVVEVSEWIWRNHEEDLRLSGDLFYTWQYDVRWVAHELRRRKVLRDSDNSPRGIWILE